MILETSFRYEGLKSYDSFQSDFQILEPKLDFDAGNKKEFEKQIGTTLGIPYDYQSVMHYPVNAFAINNMLPTMVPKTKGAKIGQKDNLSDLDIVRIMKAYKCKSPGSVVPTGKLKPSLEFEPKSEDIAQP